MKKAALATLAVAIATTGCSAMLVQPSSIIPVSAACTDSYALPALDTMLAAAAGMGAVYFATRDADHRTTSAGDQESFVLTSLVVGGFYGGSALFGSSRVADCRRFKYPEGAPPAPLQSPNRLKTPLASLP